MKDSIYKKAADVLGAENRIDKCIEECAELIDRLIHYKKGVAVKARVVEELADVQVTLACVVEALNVNEHFEAEVKNRTARLAAIVRNELSKELEIPDVIIARILAEDSGRSLEQVKAELRKTLNINSTDYRLRRNGRMFEVRRNVLVSAQRGMYEKREFKLLEVSGK